jgi:hypothetical protein
MANDDLIRQYADSGVKLSRHQVDRLSPNILRTYLRKRVLVGNLENYELELLPEELVPKLYENFQSFYQNVYLFLSRKHGDDVIDNFIKYKGEKLNGDVSLIELMISNSSDELKTGKKIMDVLGSNMKTDILRALLYSMKGNASWQEDTLDIHEKRFYLIRYYTENYLKGNSHNEMYDDAVTALLHYCGLFKNTIIIANKIIDAKGSNLNSVEVESILEYADNFPESSGKGFNLVTELIIKLLKAAPQNIYPGIYIKKLTSDNVLMVLSQMPKKQLAQFHRDKVFYMCKNYDPEFAHAFEMYYSLDKFTPAEQSLIHARAKFARELKEK